MENPEVRLSDEERQEALDALDEHVRTGRLDIDEYGERSAQVTAARRRGDLEKLFTDLPRPRPSVLEEPARPGAEPVAGKAGEPTLLHRASGLALPIATIIAVVLLVTVAKTWMVFLLPIAVAVIGPKMFRHRKR